MNAKDFVLVDFFFPDTEEFSTGSGSASIRLVFALLDLLFALGFFEGVW